MIGLGCMRLSTDPDRDESRGIAVIRAALDAGVTLLDTADVYCHGPDDIGHNESLVAKAVAAWTGDRSRLVVATKGGLTRPRGRWVPNGRAKHLRSACEASAARLGGPIDLYQLHVIDPRTPLGTSVRALAALQGDGIIRDIGLCNVTVGQIEAAREIAEIVSVQVQLNPWDETNFRNGVAEYCRDHEIRCIAYRPLGGDHKRKIARDPLLREIGSRHGVSPFEMALAWLTDLHPTVTPIPGATAVASSRSLARVPAIRLTDDDRARLDARFPAGRLLRVPRTERRPAPHPDGDVVLVMGMPGAGKSTVAREFSERGYQRLNRDERGGSLADLTDALRQGLENGRRRWVLDNTYPSRQSRNAVIETAWSHGVSVRCVWMKTSVDDAQINAVSRMIGAVGHLPTPDAIKTRGKTDTNFFDPRAQFRYARELEPPTMEEGLSAIEHRSFTRRRASDLTRKAVLLEFDGVLCASVSGAPAVLKPEDVAIDPGRAAVLARYAGEEWVLLATAWRPELSAGTITADSIRRCFERVRELLEIPVHLAFCPHPAGPPICWCRKPLPGLPLALAHEHEVALDRSLLVGRSSADKTLARKLGMRYEEHDGFFASAGSG